MKILDIQHISKSYDGVRVLKDLVFGVEKGSKTALIGVNGAGKTTLMRLITGQEEPDSGQVIIAQGQRIGYLAQDRTETDEVVSRRSDTDSEQATADQAVTVFDLLASGKRDVMALEQKLLQAEEALTGLSGPELETAVAACEDLRTQFEACEGYAWRGQVLGVARGLGFDDADMDRDLQTLSGGEHMRAALGRILVEAPDILLLDEPTNHLDIGSIQWLENYLARMNQTMLLISHDRYFLDRIVDHVVEIERGRAHAYKGSYTAFAEKKKKMRESEMNAFLKQQNEIKHQEAVIEKLKQFNREKSIKRAESREKQLAKMDVIQRPEAELTGMRLTFAPATRSGDEVLTMQEARAAFDGRVLFEDVSLQLHRGEHVALIGDNGTGKSTLLKMLVKAADGQDQQGVFQFGTGVTIGYYDQ